ncbi:helix-hairpin-helix domain-containing protein, partial [Anaerotignum lactatifermentans]
MKSELCQIPGVGPKMASYLEQQGIHTIADLKGKDPQEIYEKDCAAKGFRVDPCALY